MKYTRRCELREQKGHRVMAVKEVTSVQQAVDLLKEMLAMQPIED